MVYVGLNAGVFGEAADEFSQGGVFHREVVVELPVGEHRARAEGGAHSVGEVAAVGVWDRVDSIFRNSSTVSCVNSTHKLIKLSYLSPCFSIIDFTNLTLPSVAGKIPLVSPRTNKKDFPSRKIYIYSVILLS